VTRRALCWIRRDLRLSDNRALFEASANFTEIGVVFVFDSMILDALDDQADRRVTFIMESLRELDESLRKQGSSLIVLHGDPAVEIPKLALQLNCQAVISARDFEPYAAQRDETVKNSLLDAGISFETVKDQVIFERGEILSQSGTPFRVFTPFSRRWLELFEPQIHAARFDPDLTKLLPSSSVKEQSIGLNYEAIGFTKNDPWLAPGETSARNALNEFEAKIDSYGEARDIPSLAGTSFLSVHLRFGTISPRDAVRTALRHESRGAKKWLTELIWREFYQDILANNPQVIETTFDPVYANLEWPGSQEYFETWKDGRTGYPIVDAAMRCF
jgi:deoxyribodipyrimidine photo-lyase